PRPLTARGNRPLAVMKRAGCTPGSVPPPCGGGDGHLSRDCVAAALQRSTRGHRRATEHVPCSTLLRARFTQQARSPGPLVVSYTTVSPLPRSPPRRRRRGGLLSVALA